MPSTHLDPVLAEGARLGTMHLVAEAVREVLLDVPAARDVQHLRAAADREHGHVALERSPHQLELELVALAHRAGGLVVCGSP